MATEKVIVIKVKDKEVEETTQKVESLGLSIEKVTDTQEKTSKSLKDGFEGEMN